MEYEVRVIVFNIHGRGIAGPKRATPVAADSSGQGGGQRASQGDNQGDSQDGEQEGEEKSEPSDTPTPAPTLAPTPVPTPTPVPSEPDRLPSAPRNLTATQNGAWIDVTWSAPEDEGNPPFDGYEVHSRFRTASGWSVWIEGLKWSRGTTGVKMGTRDGQIEKEIRVRAVNDAGKGPFAGPVRVTID